MKNMDKRKILIVSLAILFAIFFSLTIKSLRNKPVILDNVKLKEINIDRSMFSFYLEQANGTYSESASTSWPGNTYVFNEERSICVDTDGLTIANALVYSSGTVTATVGKTAYCYLYFDTVKPDITVNVVNYNATYNTQTPTCTTNDSVYFNTKYQALVFNNVGNKASNCTLTSSNTTYTAATLEVLTSTPYYLKDKVESVAVDETANTVTNSATVPVTLTVGYRYEGTNPNNYIWFNNEMWRIIGVVPVCTNSGCDDSGDFEDLVKIIRKDSIGGIAYDALASGYTGAWGSNTLYTLLNTKYWGKQDATDTATCYGYQATAKTKCDYTVIGLSSSDYYGSMVEQNVYWNTGASTIAANAKTVYQNESQTQQVQGNIGLMNASDYGYGSSESTRGNLSAYNTSEITLANWLYTNNYEWTITQTTPASSVLFVSNNGYVRSNNANTGYAVRPVLYLKDSVYVVGGDGSEATPYQVALGS